MKGKAINSNNASESFKKYKKKKQKKSSIAHSKLKTGVVCSSMSEIRLPRFLEARNEEDNRIQNL